MFIHDTIINFDRIRIEPDVFCIVKHRSYISCINYLFDLDSRLAQMSRVRYCV